MITVVISQGQDLLQKGLAIRRVWNRLQKVLRFGKQFNKSGSVLLKCAHGPAPRPRIRRSLALRPVSFGPFRGLVTSIPAELKNVRLGQSEVLEKLPCG